MPPISFLKFPVYAWSPPDYHPIHKITVTRHDGTVDELTLIYNATFTDGSTEMIGDFKIEVINSGTYTSVWTGSEVVRLYLDYATSATTLTFKGITEKVEYAKNKIILKGRSNALKVFGKSVTKSYDNWEVSAIILDLFDSYGDNNFTTTGVETTSTYLSVSWSAKYFWDCIKELCNASNSDCYIDCNDGVQFFEKNSRLNITDAIVHDYNMTDMIDFGKDYSQARNKVTVCGQDVDGHPLFYTAEDTDSQVSLGRILEYPINDTNLTTLNEIKQRAENELNNLKDVDNVGTIKSILLPTLKPGEKLRISDQENGIEPLYYSIRKFTHKIDYTSSEFMSTETEINLLDISISKLFKGRIEAEQKQVNITNQYDMKYSYPITFLDTTYQESASSSMSLSDEKLICDGTSSTWTSTTYTMPITASQVELRINTEGTGIIFKVRASNTASYQTIQPNTLTTLINSGTQLKIQIIMNSTSQAVKSICIMYK